MDLKQLFFPTSAPDDHQMAVGRNYLIAEGAVAAIIYSIGTGNFLAGYLSYLGASVSTCAAVAIIPEFGCVLQFVSPFLFERLHFRKLAIWVLCLIFRGSLGMVMLVPLFIHSPRAVIAVVLALYTIAFLAAGFVTPGLQHMTLGVAPDGHRGAFMAQKEIVAASVNSVATLLLGRQLDYFTAQGSSYTGFLIIGGLTLSLAAVDSLLLASVREQPVALISKMRLGELARPLRDPVYQKVLRYCVVGGLMSGLAAPFLSIYELRVLGLSHTFITSAGMVSAVVGMAGSWFWGHYADRTSWKRIICLTAFGSLLCTLGWAFAAPVYARPLGAVLMVGSAAFAGGSGIASTNLQFACAPPDRKTTYIGVTMALASITSCGASVAGTTLQPALQNAVGDHSIAILFFVSGVGGLCNLFINGRRLPNVK